MYIQGYEGDYVMGDDEFSLGDDGLGLGGILEGPAPILQGYYGGYYGGPVQPPPRPARGPQIVARQQVLPLDETTVVASGTANVEANPQRGFAPLKFFVPSTVGVNFKITDIKVGQETQFVSTGVVYAELFSEVSVGMNLKGTPARLGNQVVVSVVNRDAANSQVFTGTFTGNTYET